MVDLIYSGGVIADVLLTYEVTEAFLSDSFIQGDTLLEFRFSDGSRGAIRKRDIIGFYESVPPATD